MVGPRDWWLAEVKAHLLDYHLARKWVARLESEMVGSLVKQLVDLRGNFVALRSVVLWDILMGSKTEV